MRDVDKALRKSLPSFSSSAVLCCAVRAGQVSMRQKMITTTNGDDERDQSDCERQEMRPDLETE